MDPSRVVPRVQPGLGSESREGGTSTPLPTPARSEGKITDGVTLTLSGDRGGFLGARWTRVGHTCQTGARGTLLRHDSQPSMAGRTRISKICVRFLKSALASSESVWRPKCVGVFYGGLGRSPVMTHHHYFIPVKGPQLGGSGSDHHRAHHFCPDWGSDRDSGRCD